MFIAHKELVVHSSKLEAQESTSPKSGHASLPKAPKHINLESTDQGCNKREAVFVRLSRLIPLATKSIHLTCSRPRFALLINHRICTSLISPVSKPRSLVKPWQGQFHQSVFLDGQTAITCQLSEASGHNILSPSAFEDKRPRTVQYANECSAKLANRNVRAERLLSTALLTALVQIGPLNLTDSPGSEPPETAHKRAKRSDLLTGWLCPHPAQYARDETFSPQRYLRRRMRYVRPR